MVSFQCHACGDVVKKPKLDQHHGRCHAGFDCIDCSVTFHTPTEYKLHITCISEAEKYQKSLYKGPKNGKRGGDVKVDNTNGQDQGYARGGRGGFSGRGRGNGRGGFQGRGGYHGGARPRNEGTGANGTPLGTPQRMSPVTAPADDTPTKHEVTADGSAATPVPIVDDASSTPSPTKSEDNRHTSFIEKPKKEKKHKDKESKSESKSKHSSRKVKADESIVAQNAAALSPPLPTENPGDVTEQKEKRKRAKGEQPEQLQSKVTADKQAEREEFKKKKKKKESKSDSGSQIKDKVSKKERKKKDKDKEDEPIGDGSRTEVEEQEKPTITDATKEKSQDKALDMHVFKTGSQPPDEEDSKKKKKKTHKSEGGLDGVVAPVADPVTTPPDDKDSKKKSTKRKREDEHKERDVTVADDRQKQARKKSKESCGVETTPAITEVSESASRTVPPSGKKRKREGGTKDDEATSKPVEGKEKRRKRTKE